MRIQLAIPERHVSAPVLNGALEAVTRLNESLIKAGETPTDLDLIRRGAIWKPEPPGDEHFDHGKEIASRGWGDCDDWAPLRAARLRATGEDPGARAVVRKSGRQRWHATVIRSEQSKTLPPGSEDDPSVDAGMPGGARQVGIRGAWLPVMRQASTVSGSYIATPRLALRPIADRHGQIESWQARTDLPWHWRPNVRSPTPLETAMVTLHRSPVSSQAIVGAARGAVALGVANGANAEHLRRMSAIADLCEGYPWEEVAERYGHEHATAAGSLVGSFFGKAFKGIKKGLRGAVKFAAPALSLVPGGGLASAALHAATPALKRSLAKGRHAPPAMRAPTASTRPTVQHAVQREPAGHGAPQFLPYPYPLPYPVPGWAAPTGQTDPGVAWPPR